MSCVHPHHHDLHHHVPHHVHHLFHICFKCAVRRLKMQRMRCHKCHDNCCRSWGCIVMTLNAGDNEDA